MANDFETTYQPIETGEYIAGTYILHDDIEALVSNHNRLIGCFLPCDLYAHATAGESGGYEYQESTDLAPGTDSYIFSWVVPAACKDFAHATVEVRIKAIDEDVHITAGIDNGGTSAVTLVTVAGGWTNVSFVDIDLGSDTDLHVWLKGHSNGAGNAKVQVARVRVMYQALSSPLAADKTADTEVYPIDPGFIAAPGKPLATLWAKLMQDALPELVERRPTVWGYSEMFGLRAASSRAFRAQAAAYTLQFSIRIKPKTAKLKVYSIGVANSSPGCGIKVTGLWDATGTSTDYGTAPTYDDWTLLTGTLDTKAGVDDRLDVYLISDGVGFTSLIGIYIMEDWT